MNKNLEVHFKSGKDDWETPDDFFALLHKEFNFTLDVCATKHNTKCRRYLTPAANGLKSRWSGCCWCNPPYSSSDKWVFKAWKEATAGNATTVMLLPARTDKISFHSFIWDTAKQRPRPGVSIRFLRGRLKFVGAPTTAPFPSMVVIFRKRV